MDRDDNVRQHHRVIDRSSSCWGCCRLMRLELDCWRWWAVYFLCQGRDDEVRCLCVSLYRSHNIPNRRCKDGTYDVNQQTTKCQHGTILFTSTKQIKKEANCTLPKRLLYKQKAEFLSLGREMLLPLRFSIQSQVNREDSRRCFNLQTVTMANYTLQHKSRQRSNTHQAAPTASRPSPHYDNNTCPSCHRSIAAMALAATTPRRSQKTT